MTPTSRPLALLVPFVLAVAASAATLVIAAAPSYAASCDDSWNSATSGSWSDPTKWTNGVPDYFHVPANGDVCIDFPGTYTVTVDASVNTNSVHVGGATSGTQTLAIGDSSSGVRFDFSGVNTVSNHGVLELDATATGNADLSSGITTAAGGSVVVGSGGTFRTAGINTTDLPAVDVPITNQAGGTLDFGAPLTVQRFSNALTTNSGAVTVDSGATLSLSSGASFTQSAATLAVNGTLTMADGTFTATGGAESGNPVTLTGGTISEGAMTGAFDIANSSTLYGDIPTGQTVEVDGSANQLNLVVPGSTTVHGTLEAHPGAAPNFADVQAMSGNGSLTVASGGTISTTGDAGSAAALFDLPITNQAGGAVHIAAPNSNLRSNALLTNSGAVTVDAGKTLALSSGASFTQSAGTLVVNGTLTMADGNFTAAGGAQSGNPVTITGGSLSDGGGTGAYDITNSATLNGNIPAGQTVTADAAANSLNLVVPGAPGGTIVNGSLVLRPSPAGFTDLQGTNGNGSITVASGGTFATAAVTGSGAALLDIPLTAQAGSTVSISAPTTVFRFGANASNSGTLTVHDGGHLDLGGGPTLTNTANGTIGVTVNATAHTSSGISGPVILAGTLAVQTIGTPTLGTLFTPITPGPVSGTFSAFSFGPHAYTVSYPPGQVQLSTAGLFSVVPSGFTAHQNRATGLVKIASVNNAPGGTYSAKVNWGDGSATQSATVSGTGTTRTVTGPSHTYSSTGAFHVSTTVANTNGTVVTASTTVRVTVAPAQPRITSVSPASGPTKGGQRVTIRGSGFASTTKVKFNTTAGTSVSVSSSRILTVRVPAHAAGTVNVFVTTIGGTSPRSVHGRYTFINPPRISSVSPARGSRAGGHRITITGSGFTGKTSVRFSSTPGTAISIVSSRKLTVRTPAHRAGTVYLYVTTAGGRSTKTAHGRYTFTRRRCSHRRWSGRSRYAHARTPTGQARRVEKNSFEGGSTRVRSGNARV